MSDEAAEVKRIRREQEEHLIRLIEDDINEAWLRNTLIWLGVVGGSFVVVLGVLVILAGT